MRKNEIYSMECTSLGASLEGVGHLDGKTVFVEGILPGEKADVRIVKVQKNHAFGILAGDVASPATCRRACDCASYPKCGGCSCRHMQYEETLKWKRQQVSYCFHSIAHMDVDVAPVIGMDEPFHYRNKTSYPVCQVDGHPVMGFYSPRSHRVIQVRECLNGMKPSDEIAQHVLQWMEKNAIAGYDETTGDGDVRHLVIRVSAEGRTMVILVVCHESVPCLPELADMLKKLAVSTLVLNVNAKQTNVILGERYQTVYGSGTLEDTILSNRFTLSPASFFQVNLTQTEKLYKHVIRFADLHTDETVWDLYCGAGTISLSVAPYCKEVVGIEVIREAVENATYNAKMNQITNATFHAGRTEDILPELIQSGSRPSKVVVDPPRKGLESSVIDRLCQIAPETIIYVSCNPATLARDCELFTEKGYMVQSVQPVDMFCWTAHVETVCLLTHKG